MADFGKFVSRSLGIGEKSLDEAVQLGVNIFEGDILGSAIAASELLASEKERSRPPITAIPVKENDMLQQRSTISMESGGYMDRPVEGNYLEGFVGQIPNIIGQVFRRLPQGTGSTVGGVVGGVAGAALLGGSDACGCGPKAFVRFNKCGDPIITRKMKKQAIEAVNCSGAESAAMTLTGGDVNLLNMIISKQFPPMRKGISGRQMATAKRVNRALLTNVGKLGYKCTPMPSKMGVK